MDITLDGSKLKSIEDFHNEIMRILELPLYYGKNLDALWDCLTSWIDLPLTLTWKDYEISRNNLGDFADRALQLFKDAEIEAQGFEIKTE